MSNKIIKVYVVGGDIGYTNLFLDKIEIVDNISDANIVLFTGGEDVCPYNYGEDAGSRTSYNKSRDNSEITMFHEARQYNKFIVAICRGSQLCTVLSGGSLIQHVTNHAISGTHKIHLMNEDVDIDITSTHHQMMFPFYMDKNQYQILAKSMVDLSTTYLNGDDQERKLPSNFVEPEIVYYNQTNCLCIQGHPEYMPKNSSAVKYINVLIREYLEDTIETIPEALEEDEEVQAINGNGILNQLEVNDRIQIDNDIYARFMVNAANIQEPRPRRNAPNVWDIDPDFN